MAPPLQNNSKYRQGIFKPKNTNKFLGGGHAVYRSGLELKFMRFCDNNPNIIKWGSENVIVPYISPVDNKVHRYFVDNFIVIREGQIIKKYLIEIKPFKQLSPPTTKYKKKQHLLYEQGMYNINQAKWRAAKEHAKRMGCEFMILTEKELG